MVVLLDWQTCFFYGDKVEKNYALAMKWYKKSADYTESKMKIGEMYLNDMGVEKDIVKAYAWYNLSSTDGK